MHRWVISCNAVNWPMPNIGSESSLRSDAGKAFLRRLVRRRTATATLSNSFVLYSNTRHALAFSAGSSGGVRISRARKTILGGTASSGTVFPGKFYHISVVITKDCSPCRRIRKPLSKQMLDA